MRTPYFLLRRLLVSSWSLTISLKWSCLDSLVQLRRNKKIVVTTIMKSKMITDWKLRIIRVQRTDSCMCILAVHCYIEIHFKLWWRRLNLQITYFCFSHLLIVMHRLICCFCYHCQYVKWLPLYIKCENIINCGTNMEFHHFYLNCFVLVMMKGYTCILLWFTRYWSWVKDFYVQILNSFSVLLWNYIWDVILSSLFLLIVFSTVSSQLLNSSSFMYSWLSSLMSLLF